MNRFTKVVLLYFVRLELCNKYTAKENSQVLQVGLATVNRDISYLKEQAKTNIRKYIDERLTEEYEKGLLEQIPRKEAWITAQSTEDKREKIRALTLDNQDSQQNALKKVNELTIAQVKDIFWKEGNAQYAKIS